MWKLHEVQVSVSINKALLEPSYTRVCGCFQVAVAELSSCDRLCGPQSWKYLLLVPLQKMFPDQWSESL